MDLNFDALCSLALRLHKAPKGSNLPWTSLKTL